MSTGSGEIHNVLEAACKACRADAKRYANGPKPVIDNHAYLSLAVWMVERSLSLLDEPARTKVEEILEVSRGSLRGEKINHSQLNRMSNEAVVNVRSPVPGMITGLCVETIESSINNVCGKGSRAIATALSHRLPATFLDELASEIARLDAITLIRKQELAPKKEKPPEITACLWRGATGVKTTHIIVRLADGTHGLIAKTKGRWTWQVGERDHILASLPDAHMESAVAAVLGGGGGGGGPTTPTPKRQEQREEEEATISETARFASRAVGVALSPERDCAWIVTRDGRLYEWPSRRTPREASGRVGKVTGIHAGRDGVVATWGSVLTRWRNLVPTTIADVEVDGACVRDDGSLVWWYGDEIHFGGDTKKKKKTVRGESDQAISVCAAANLIVGVTRKSLRKYSLDEGRLIGDLEIGAAGASSYALSSSDGTKIATWTRSAKAKDVHIASLDDGKSLLTLTVDSGKIDQVVFTDDGSRILVRYHDGQRLAVFDGQRGTRTHRMQARELGSSGSRVDDFFPLRSVGPKKTGAILAFAPYPRGEALLLDYDAQLLQRWSLGKLYSGGAGFVADAGADVLFAHGVTSSYALRFRFKV